MDMSSDVRNGHEVEEFRGHQTFCSPGDRRVPNRAVYPAIIDFLHSPKMNRERLIQSIISRLEMMSTQELLDGFPLTELPSELQRQIIGEMTPSSRRSYSQTSRLSYHLTREETSRIPVSTRPLPLELFDQMVWLPALNYKALWEGPIDSYEYNMTITGRYYRRTYLGPVNISGSVVYRFFSSDDIDATENIYTFRSSGVLTDDGQIPDSWTTHYDYLMRLLNVEPGGIEDVKGCEIFKIGTIWVYTQRNFKYTYNRNDTRRIRITNLFSHRVYNIPTRLAEPRPPVPGEVFVKTGPLEILARTEVVD